jgi:hypothetical protein
VGIVPEKALMPKDKYLRFEQIPIAVGIFPTKLPFLEVALPVARKYNMPDKNPISLGRVPVNPLPDTSKWVSLVSLKRTEGIVVPA